MTTTNEQAYDAIIIGGSFSGLSAAMAMARARLRVLVIDANEPCNARVPHAHNLLTHDGEPPAVIRAKARADVAKYPTLHRYDDRAEHVSGRDGAFVVRTADGRVCNGRKLLLALGVRDELPGIAGFMECWGISAAACPFCHGYEVADKPWAVLGNGAEVVEYARLLRQWSPHLTVLTNGPATLTAEQHDVLASMSVAVNETPITRLEHVNGAVTAVVLNDGNTIPCTALFARLATTVPSAFFQELGCAFTPSGLIEVDPMQRTTVPGVFASGDCASPMRALSAAMASGTMAGAAMVHDLIAPHH